MKEHVQKTGVRKYAGDDLIELQAEPLKVLQAFFAEYGACVLKGVEVTPAEGENNLYNVGPGIVSLAGTDADGADTFKVVPFAGVEAVTLPIYLTLTNTVSERVYGDGKVKPIAYNYTAAATNVQPVDVPFLEITTTGGKRFLDVIKLNEKLDKIGNGKDVTVTFAEAAERVNITSGEKLSGLFSKVQKWFAGLKTIAFTGKAADLEQDETHRLVTDTEKTGWADKYTKALTYTRAEIEQKIADVVNSAPGTLDTLQELAAALGNDPNFATSITALIGGKADRVHTHTIANVENLQNELAGKLDKNKNIQFEYPDDFGGYWIKQRIGDVETVGLHFNRSIAGNRWSQLDIHTKGDDGYVKRAEISERGLKIAGNVAWHSGNFNPDSMFTMGLGDVNKADLDTFVNRKSGTYNVNDVGVSNLLIVLAQIGASCSALEFFVDFRHMTRVGIRKTVDGNRYSGPFRELAYWDETQEQLNLKADKKDVAGVLRLYSKYYVDGRNSSSIENTWKAGATISSISRFSNYKGQYRINHNLGHTNYTVILNGTRAYGGTSVFVALLAITNNYFDIETADNGSSNDANFEFTILLY